MTDAPIAKSLTIRKTADGVVFEGALPDEHTFSSRFLDREIASGLVAVQVVIHGSEGDLVYEAIGYERDEDGNPNFTGLKARRVR